jgi:hypothetical protein
MLSTSPNTGGKRAIMAVRLNKLFRKEAVIILFVLAAAILLRTTGPHSMNFESLTEFKRFAAENGLLLHPTGVGGFQDHLYVSDHPVTLDHLLTLTKTNFDASPGWRGILWVHGYSKRNHVLPTSIAGPWRVWGRLLVAGDEKLMDCVEELHRSGS